MTASSRNPYLAPVLVLYAGLTLLYSLGVPLWEAPDEPSHYLCVRRISDGRNFSPPRFTAGQRSIWNDGYIYSLYESSQPPLYYLMAAPAMKTLAVRVLPLGEGVALPPVRPDFHRQGNLFIHDRKTVWDLKTNEVRGHLFRLFSIIPGVIAVYLVYRMARAVFPGHPAATAAAAGFIACLPQFNFISGAISNDSLAVLVGTAGLFALVRLADPGGRPSGRGWSVLGLLLALGLLTKMNLVFLFPASLLVIVWKVRDGGEPRRILVALGLAFIPSLALVAAAGLIFHLGSGIHASEIFQRLLRINPLQVAPPRLNLMVVDLYQSFWARFGWMSIAAGGWMYCAWGGFLLACLAGWIFPRRGAEALPPGSKRSLILLLTSFLVLLLGVVKNNLLVPQSQGRFLFPALGAVSILLAAGWLRLFDAKRQAAAALMMVLFLSALSLIALFGYLLPASYP